MSKRLRKPVVSLEKGKKRAKGKVWQLIVNRILVLYVTTDLGHVAMFYERKNVGILASIF